MEMHEELDKILEAIQTLKKGEIGKHNLYFEDGKFELYPAAQKAKPTFPLFVFSTLEIKSGLTSTRWGLLTQIIYQLCKTDIIAKEQKPQIVKGETKCQSHPKH